ncbi:methylated-DNA--[protein]-cysteine S-methyltransferase [Neptunomonas antarctica]|uniref:methylated-DNA--[protein]-cysteine S-methyltransferase n=1 Tax=Neptunomonas antarctica TaxID=619304 RepID=A0A1N7J2F9_9GAMM|nr:methylated-DNA--[protein]-cysteine S-methyltransferase [Neptunomonas antarctica]SIS43530.1 methylated-DNA-[protein]-cysteine S-methyltransferase [Neptunomonas antarctica]
MISYRTWHSSFGEMLATEENQQLTGCYRIGQKHQPAIASQWQEEPDHPVFIELEKQLEAFASHPEHLFTLPLAPKGTPFQQSVWQALKLIPAGETLYYQQLADSIDQPESARSVAAAIGRNPLLIIIPCHRVIGKNGNLTGYAAGLELKQQLLTIEAAIGL